MIEEKDINKLNQNDRIEYFLKKNNIDLSFVFGIIVSVIMIFFGTMMVSNAHIMDAKVLNIVDDEELIDAQRDTIQVGAAVTILGIITYLLTAIWLIIKKRKLQQEFFNIEPKKKK